MNILEAQNSIVETFEMFDDELDKYTYLISLAKDVRKMPEHLKDDEHLIKECQSRLWLHLEAVDGVIYIWADSDVLVIKGIISLLIKVLSGQAINDVRDVDIFFLDKIGLGEHLSKTRANGLGILIANIKQYCSLR